MDAAQGYDVLDLDLLVAFVGAFVLTLVHLGVARRRRRAAELSFTRRGEHRSPTLSGDQRAA